MSAGSLPECAAMYALAVQSELVKGTLPRLPPGCYTSAQTVFNELMSPPDGGPPPVRLLKVSWILKRADALERAATSQERRELALPARQDLEAVEDGAYLTLDELKALPRESWMGEPNGKLAVGSTSHPWLTPDHPDPEGQKLRALAKTIRMAQNRHRNSHPFPSEAGMFIDWASLYQNHSSHGPRSAAQQAAFSHALHNMQIWYVHTLVTTFLLDELPDGYEQLNTYGSRGWCTCEFRWSALAKQSSNSAWPPIIKVSSSAIKRFEQSYMNFEPDPPKREPPMTPEAMARLVATKYFTSNADLPMVIALNVQTILSVLGDARQLFYAGLEWSDPDALALAEALPLCSNLQELSLSRNYIQQGGMAALVAAFAHTPGLEVLVLSDNKLFNAGATVLGDAFRLDALPALHILYVEMNDIGAPGLTSLASAIESAPRTRLTELFLSNNDVGDDGAASLVKALQTDAGAQLTTLTLGGNRIGDAGGEAFGSAFMQGAMPSLSKLSLEGNRVSDHGSSKLAYAVAEGSAKALSQLVLSQNDVNVRGARELGLAVHRRKSQHTDYADLRIFVDGNNVKEETETVTERRYVSPDCRTSGGWEEYKMVKKIKKDVVLKTFEEAVRKGK